MIDPNPRYTQTDREMWPILVETGIQDLNPRSHSVLGLLQRHIVIRDHGVERPVPSIELQPGMSPSYSHPARGCTHISHKAKRTR